MAIILDSTEDLDKTRKQWMKDDQKNVGCLSFRILRTRISGNHTKQKLKIVYFVILERETLKCWKVKCINLKFKVHFCVQRKGWKVILKMLSLGGVIINNIFFFIFTALLKFSPWGCICYYFITNCLLVWIILWNTNSALQFLHFLPLPNWPWAS